MVGFSNTRTRKVADRQIKRLGGRGILRSDAGDRLCFVHVTDYTPNEKRGELIQATDRVGIVSTIAPDGSFLEKPDHNTERLVRLDKVTGAELEPTLRIVAPAGSLDPAGYILYWELQLRE